MNNENADDRVTLCNDGKYRWVFEVNMLKNPTILFDVYKVFFMTYVIMFILIFLIGACNGDIINPFTQEGLTAAIYVTIGTLVIGYIGYLIVALAYNKKYIVLFIMDETGVVHKQMPKTMKKAKVMGMISLMTGLASGSLSKAGMGLLIATRDSLTSSFESVKTVKAQRKFNLIKVNEPFAKNRIFVNDKDFDFVYNFICSHCPKAKCS